MTTDCDRLAKLVDAKLQILQLLRRLAQQQLDIVAGGDLTNLLRLLAGKQAVMDQLQKLERQLDPFRGEDPEKRAWPTQAAREACQRTVAACNEILAEIMSLEKEAEGRMIRRRDKAGDRLAGMHASSEARHGYAAAAIAQQPDFSSEG